jgi:FMN phosphatase YigB (HAD superfamily)
MPRLSLATVTLELDAVLFDAGGTLLRLDYAFLRAIDRRGRGGGARARQPVARRAAWRRGALAELLR